MRVAYGAGPFASVRTEQAVDGQPCNLLQHKWLACAIFWGREAIMSKHILDRKRTLGGSAKSVQYVRIESGERPHPQSKMLQKQSQQTDTQTRARRFLDIDRREA